MKHIDLYQSAPAIGMYGLAKYLGKPISHEPRAYPQLYGQSGYQSFSSEEELFNFLEKLSSSINKKFRLSVALDEKFIPFDIGNLAEDAHEHGELFVVDARGLGPALINPFQWGSDLVLDYFDGSHFLIGPLLEDANDTRKEQDLYKLAMHHLQRERQSDTTKILLAYLSAHPKVEQVLHNSLYQDELMFKRNSKYFPRNIPNFFSFSLKNPLNRNFSHRFLTTKRIDSSNLLACIQRQSYELKTVIYAINTPTSSWDSHFVVIVGIEWINDLVDAFEELLT
ncbi:MAG: hypothetical protein Q4E22_00935 [Coriobacteriia bacterium]|nr:hypothetical protein [Coriobacteriia bacterium]